MRRRRFLVVGIVGLALMALACGADLAWAQTGPVPGIDYTKPHFA